MRVTKVFNRLFGQADSQVAPSLGHGVEDEQEGTNLGANVQQEKDGDAPTAKGEESHKPKEDNDTEAQDKQEGPSAHATQTYNLIILDESGSMNCVRPQTISGCNETLNSIRHMAKEQPDIKQYVSIFCFDNTNSRYIFRNVPVEDTRDLTEADYRPCGCTPLYDAIGYTVTQLEKQIATSDAVAVVTIITDGYENASRQWNIRSVVQLITRLKEKGWVFTFIGANIDVEKAAKGIGIDSYVKFDQTDEGMSGMFAQERRSRRAYNMKRAYMQKMHPDASPQMREKIFAGMNCNYFVDKERVAPDFIRALSENEVCVFGSDTSGRHDCGTALYAKEHFGAEEGKAEGPQGKSYAIPTQGSTLKELREAIERFTGYAVEHPQCKFMVTIAGCEAAGFSVEQVAPLFREAYSFGNVYVPASFMPYMPKDIFDY